MGNDEREVRIGRKRKTGSKLAGLGVLWRCDVFAFYSSSSSSPLFFFFILVLILVWGFKGTGREGRRLNFKVQR